MNHEKKTIICDAKTTAWACSVSLLLGFGWFEATHSLLVFIAMAVYLFALGCYLTSCIRLFPGNEKMFRFVERGDIDVLFGKLSYLRIFILILSCSICALPMDTAIAQMTQLATLCVLGYIGLTFNIYPYHTVK